MEIIVIIDLPQEANTLTVLASGVDQMLGLGYLPHLVFHVMTYREDGFLKLPVVNLRQEIGLVFHRVGAGDEPFLAIDQLGAGIMARGYQVVVVSPLLMEGTKLDKSVAHNVGIGRETGLHLLHGLTGHLVPILLMAIHHLQTTAETGCHGDRKSTRLNSSHANISYAVFCLKK